MDYIGSLNIINFFELGFIVLIIYFAYKYTIFIAGPKAKQPLKGILMLLLALLLSIFLTKIFNFQIVGRFLESVVNIIIFSLVVIFQPELRRVLGYLGQPGILNKNLFVFENETEVKSLIVEISEAVKFLSKSHIGALMVIQNTTNLENYIEVGTKLDAQVSTEILLTIFHPNTPLHDGAVVIGGDKLIAAGVLLPLTEDPKLSWQYGTRHRAAIGMSEISDAACIVVSEETGEISIAQGGILTKFANFEELKTELGFLYGFSEAKGDKTTDKKLSQANSRLKPIFSKVLSKLSNIFGEQGR